MIYAAFDIGNVLCHVDFNPIINNLSKTLNISKDEAMYFLNRVQKLHDVGLTSLSDELRVHFKIRSEVIVEDLIKSWNACIQPNIEVLEMIYDLIKNYELQIAILSNIGVEHKENIKNILGNAITHFSCDVGCRKPSFLYYQSFIQQYPEFKNCVYVDDLSENLESSKKFGFKPYQFDISKWSKDFYLSHAPEIIKLKNFIVTSEAKLTFI